MNGKSKCNPCCRGRETILGGVMLPNGNFLYFLLPSSTLRDLNQCLFLLHTKQFACCKCSSRNSTSICLDTYFARVRNCFWFSTSFSMRSRGQETHFLSLLDAPFERKGCLRWMLHLFLLPSWPACLPSCLASMEPSGKGKYELVGLSRQSKLLPTLHTV